MPWGTSGSTFATELTDKGQQREVRWDTKGWSVTGDPALSDHFDVYTVSLAGTHYECSCYAHAWGDVRRRRICGHVRDVIVWRKENPDDKRSEKPEGRNRGPGTPANGTGGDVHRPGDEAGPAGVQRGGTEGQFVRRRNIPGLAGPQAEAPREGIAVGPDSLSPQPAGGTRGIPTNRPNRVDVDNLTPDDNRLGSPALPAQFEVFRPHQLVAVKEILDHFADGKRVVFLDAPTGSGKTLIGEMARRLLGANQTLYVCNNKALQDQFVGDFGYASLLKGRANYPTLDNPLAFPEVSCADCNREQAPDGTASCDECWAVEKCHYLMARGEAELASLAVLNTAYLLTVANKARMFTHRDLVICDEADELESELMRHIEVAVTKGTRNWLNIDLPQNVTDMTAWGEWLEGVAHDVSAKAQRMSRRNRQDRKRRRSLEEMVGQIRSIVPRLGEDWVVDGYEDARYRRGTVERETVRFRPVQVKDIAEEYLWQWGQRWLLMSATIISGAQMAADLGLEDGTWAEVRVPSTFEPYRRPVFLDRHVGPVVRKTEDEARPKLVAEIARIGEEWPEERMLVHTHSYDLTNYVYQNLSLPRPILTYQDSRSREGVLGRWLETANGVLLAPSFDRGVDLFDDRCRVQVIAKAPFPYLGDKQVSKRMRGPGGQVWYVVETIRSIVQATGRVMRSEDDWGATYILDGSVWRLLGENGSLFPGWWREAVVKGLDSQSQEIREGFEGVSR